jgi:hypothetical protein
MAPTLDRLNLALVPGPATPEVLTLAFKPKWGQRLRNPYQDPSL